MLTDITRAITQRIEAAVTGEIAWPDRGYDPRLGVPYTQVRFAGRDRRAAGVGPTAPKIWQGVLYLVVHEPPGGGMVAADQRAQAVAEAFPRGLSLVSGAATVIVEDCSIQAPQSAADWVAVPVAVFWTCMEP